MSAKNKDSTTGWSEPDDAPELTEEQFQKGHLMVGVDEVDIETFQQAVKEKKLGAPKKEHPKVAVTIRYSPEVIDFFKLTGKGWQTRMNSVLKDYIHHQEQ